MGDSQLDPEQQLVQHVFLGYAQPATTIIPPIYPQYHYEPPPGSLYNYDPKKAGQILTADGWKMCPGGIRVKNGKQLKLRLYFGSDSPTYTADAPYVKSWLNAIGIDVIVAGMSENTETQDIGNGDYDMFIWGWGVEPNPDFQLSVFTCGQRSAGSPPNYTPGWSDSFFCNKQYDQLYAEQKSLAGTARYNVARTMLGLERATSGQVRFEGQAISYRTAALRGYRRRVQLVLQDPTGSLNPRHTVYEAVAEGVRIHKLGNERQRVTDALARCGLRPPERFFERYPHELSGGQRQRVVIAGALVLEPKVLVADEPVASLDASVRGEILSLLLRLRDELRLAALVVTHDLGLAWNIADRLAVMYLGRIVEVGTPEQVFADPQHPYTRALMSVLPESPIEPIVLTGEPPDATLIPGGCRFHPRCPELANGTAAAAG